MRRIIASIAAVAVLVAAAPAVAKSAPNPTEIDKVYLRMSRGPTALRDMVGCLVNQQPSMARSLFDVEPGSPAYAELQRKFFDPAVGGNCLWRTQKLGTTYLMALGYVAERLIDVDGVVGVVRPAVQTNVRGGGTYQWTVNNLADAAAARSLPLAYCLNEGHGDRVAEIIATKLVSKQERDLFNSMSGDISDCIPIGQKWTLQPHILRAALAIAYYKSSRTPGAVGSASNAQG